MTRKRFHGLKKPKIRATWNKYNLFNISRMKNLSTPFYTFYQQKWKAKSTARHYHGEQIREKQWQRMFTPRLNAVVPMDHRYLAKFDGSELAAGRGSGAELAPGSIEEEQRFKRQHIPYMNMTFAPIERRLDTAIFRALFASSARQARQFVTHGKVKVNGKKMPYPGYLLNPGDMFQVDPQRVLYATGATKDKAQAKNDRKTIRRNRRRNAAFDRMRAERRARKAAAAEAKSQIEDSPKPVKAPSSKLDEPELRKERRSDFQELIKKTQALMNNPKDVPSANGKKALRELVRDIKGTMAKVNVKHVKDLDRELIKYVARLTFFQNKTGSSKRLVKRARFSKEEFTEMKSTLSEGELSEKLKNLKRETLAAEEKAVREAMIRIRENPVDDSKPYATPWRPRPYMSAFAFIPRYLEVNHNICAGVYLRHPVARPNLAEVPSPFNERSQQLAFTWYLRRR